MSKSTTPKHEWMNCWRADPTVKPLTRTLLYTLADHMTPHGESCYPTIDQLQYETGMARATLIKHLKIAFEGGWIKKRAGYARSGQRWKNNTYKPSVPIGAKPIRWEETEAFKQKKYTQKDTDGWDVFEPEKAGSIQEEAGSIQEEAGSIQEEAGSNESGSWFNSDNKLVQSVDPSTPYSTSISTPYSTYTREDDTYQKMSDWEARGGDSEALKIFLNAYPKNPTKKPALKFEWFRDRGGWNCEYIAEQIIAALSVQLTECSSYATPKFCPKPENYLADEKWLDKIVPKSASDPPRQSSPWDLLDNPIDDPKILEGEFTSG